MKRRRKAKIEKEKDLGTCTGGEPIEGYRDEKEGELMSKGHKVGGKRKKG